MIRTFPRGLRALRANAVHNQDDMGLALPAVVLRAKRNGFLAGPWLYLRERFLRPGD